MAPQQGGRRKETGSIESSVGRPWRTGSESESSLPNTLAVTFTEILMEPSLPSIVVVEEVTSSSYSSRTRKHSPPTEYWPGPSRGGRPSSTPTSNTLPKITPYPENWYSSTSLRTRTLIESDKDDSSPSSTATGYSGDQRPDWHLNSKHSNNGPMYAAASIIPIVLLAIIGSIVFLRLRKRKRQRQEAAAAQISAPQMKMQSQPTVHPYIAPPPPTVSLQHTAPFNQLPPTSTPSQLQPIILGPIQSSSNGAYLTGIDTSDIVSVTSNSFRPADPFADNSSLAEPPPPYRPRSAAPPSFVSASRQSSLRASAPPPTTSQTHLIERSPFEDPREDDDNISEVLGPRLGRADDTMSAVSDLSYQHDPFVDRHP